MTKRTLFKNNKRNRNKNKKCKGKINNNRLIIIINNIIILLFIIKEYKKKTSYSSLTPKINESVYKFREISFSLLYINSINEWKFRMIRLFQCLKMASIDRTIDAPITAMELETDPAAPASGPGAGAVDRSCAEATAKKSATTSTTAKELKDNVWDAMARERVSREREWEFEGVMRCDVLFCDIRSEKEVVFIVSVETRVGPTEHGQLCVVMYWGVNEWKWVVRNSCFCFCVFGWLNDIVASSVGLNISRGTRHLRC